MRADRLRRLARCLLWSVLLVARASAGAAPTEIQMPTKKGFVAFTVEGEWPVLSLQMKYPVASAAFRIPNPVDVGTPDTSNIVLAFYDPHSTEGRTAFATPVKSYAGTAPVGEAFGPWTLYRQAAKQGETTYTILDAKRASVADVAVSVRLVWPHLAGNAADYDAGMEELFKRVLQSTRGGMAPKR